jgi:hypothetical protein
MLIIVCSLHTYFTVNNLTCESTYPLKHNATANYKRKYFFHKK